ncbi:Rho-binding antiterminator [Vibrio parahaemolyticus]|uniref:Rho-binding antiterminator n=1 Tax=Vibrio parahaemolyticus TaxID=670 RepID=UPI00387B83F7
MISCEKYDYIEIVCMHRYPIKLTMKSGEVMECTAVDTVRNDVKQECVLVKHDKCEKLVVLDNISLLEVLVDNPHFKSVQIS